MMSRGTRRAGTSAPVRAALALSSLWIGCYGQSVVLVGPDAGVSPEWVDITPPESMPEQWGEPGGPCETSPTAVCTYGPLCLTLDPSDPRVVYLCIEALGLWRSSDAGASWARLGDPAADPDPSDGLVSYLDTPVQVAVDPNDPTHLYAVQPNGGAPGFWVSRDGGATWSIPQGFRTIAESGLGYAVTSMAVDPSDFAHVLVGYGGEWPTTSDASSGIVRSTDGGASFTPIVPSGEPWSTGERSVHFLYEPAMGIGDARTWLVGEATGFWRTEDAGATWEPVWDVPPFIATEVHYDGAGVLYATTEDMPIRSEDNGRSWAPVMALASSPYTAIGGDGQRVYTRGYHGDTPAPYVSVAAGTSQWSELAGSELAGGFPIAIRVDRARRILYSANRWHGLWRWGMQ